MSLMMNRKEVNHLIIGGQQFDKSYVNRKVEIVDSSNWFVYLGESVNSDGKIKLTSSAEVPYLKTGTECVIFAKYKDAIFVGWENGDGLGWIATKNAEFIK